MPDATEGGVNIYWDGARSVPDATEGGVNIYWDGARSAQGGGMGKKWFGVGLVACAIGTTGCQMDLAPQEDCGFVRNKSNRRVSWKTQQRIDLYVHESVPAGYQTVFQKAIDAWNELLAEATGVPNVLQIAVWGFPGENRPRSDDARSTVHLIRGTCSNSRYETGAACERAGATWSEGWDPSKSSQQAVTTTYWTGSRITQADIRFNNDNFNFFIGHGVESIPHGQIHFESLSLHEKGHLLGLAHSQKEGSVMHPHLASSRQRLLQAGGPDAAAISCEYGDFSVAASQADVDASSFFSF